jgi:predicted RNA-binding protein YlqC (UPF0109 family)
MSLLKLRRADRCSIDMNSDDEVRHWSKHLKVPKEDLQKIIDKVGNSAAAVQKELATRKAGGSSLGHSVK